MSLTLSSGRRIPLAPAEGWLTLGLVLLLCLSFAWAVDDARPVLGVDRYTDFLTWAAVGGVAAGFVGPLVGWGRWRTYLIGSVLAALITPLLVGSVLTEGEAASFGAMFRATADSAVAAWNDLVVRDLLLTRQYGHHLLVIGLLVWASSMFASFAAFGHRRPLNAVLLIGTLLVVNMSFTVQPQLPYLVLYSLAALFLLIRFHTFDEQAEWVRRRIGDPTAIAGLYLRGGTIFIVTAVLGSLVLTNVAASAPLAGVWTDIGGRAIEWSQWLQRYLPESGSGRSIGPSFGTDARIGGVWTTNDSIALTWETVPAEVHEPYLAAVVYDAFSLRGWSVGEEPAVIDRAADEELLADTADALDPATRREFTMTVTPAVSRSVVYVPEHPLRINRPVEVGLLGEDGYLARITRDASRDTYTVTALIPAPEADGGPTENRLRVAGTDYPEGMLERYGRAAVPEGAITTAEARALLGEIVEIGGDNPYDLAVAAERLLKDATRFTYDTDVRDLDCADLSIVDCFAVFKRGYCEYYASAMAILLRELDIPTRLVEGFLTGEKDLASATWTVRNDDAHAWVQVYFPGYGWIDFDPTGGGRAALAPLPSGQPEASGGPSASPGASGAVPSASRRDEPDSGPVGPFTPRDDRSSAGPLIAVALLLAVIVGAFAALAWRRGPQGPVTPDGTYGAITRLATRLGFGPRPDQTVYEYAGALAAVLPDARPELETVARAKVEVAYGRQQLGPDRLAALREVHRRLRVSLLRLAFRRDRRRRR